MRRFIPLFALVLTACPTPGGNDAGPGDAGDAPFDAGPPPPLPECELIPQGFGDPGDLVLETEILASGLTVPWAIGQLPGGDLLVTERGGDVLRVNNGTATTVFTLNLPNAGEGGLLGLAVHPDFDDNGTFYLYYTDSIGGALQNLVQRFNLDGSTATAEDVVLSGIPGEFVHDGGRIRFGPDGKLYIGTGDAAVPPRSQDLESLNGKILRINDDGTIPDDNPFGDSPVFIRGVRNSQAFGWRPDGAMIVGDHGPSGLPAEAGRDGHDEINLARGGDNLGWPTIFACETNEEMSSPLITFSNAFPPGGLVVSQGGDALAGTAGDVFVGVLGFGDQIGHLHRFVLDVDGDILASEVYLRGDFGRLRDVVQAPDGSLLVTTSGCDGRGTCGGGDAIVRVTIP